MSYKKYFDGKLQYWDGQKATLFEALPCYRPVPGLIVHRHTRIDDNGKIKKEFTNEWTISHAESGISIGLQAKTLKETFWLCEQMKDYTDWTLDAPIIMKRYSDDHNGFHTKLVELRKLSQNRDELKKAMKGE